MLVIEQTLTCDICGTVMQTLKQSIPQGNVPQSVDRGLGPTIVHGWRDVCSDCYGPLVQAFWAIKAGRGGDEV